MWKTWRNAFSITIAPGSRSKRSSLYFTDDDDLQHLLLPDTSKGIVSTIPFYNNSPLARPSSPQNHRRCSRFSLQRLAICRCLRFLTLRRIFNVALCVPLVLVLVIVWFGIPPNYQDIRAFERRLPQHNWPGTNDGNLSSQSELSNGTEQKARYLRFPDHVWGHGFNNILQEALLMSHLAYLTNRSYVFEDYTWSHSPLPYALYDFALRPTRIPLNAFIAGPSAGGPMPDFAEDQSPRAVSAEYWDTVCGNADDVVVVSSRDARTDTEGSEMMRWWVEKLEEDEYRNARCLSVDSADKDVFDRFLFGDKRMLSLWPSLSTSPVLTGFAWSDLVISAIYRNFPLLRSYPSSPNAKSKALASSSSPESPSSVSSMIDPSHRTPNLPGVLAIHLRRGDYIRHCPNLDDWNAIYMGWNQFPSLPSSDRFDPFVFESGSAERRQYYMEHCLPTIEQTVQRLHVIRDEHGARAGEELKRVYVMTNEWAGSFWLKGLRNALREDGWEDVMGSAELVLDREQRYVSGAVDMGIAERAEVFVGNGFSSMSANIVMLRMANGLDPQTNRFL